MFRMQRILPIPFVLLLFLLSGCLAPQEEPAAAGPKNVILLIGDGMGLSQVSAGFYFQEEPSHFARFPYIGLINTSASSHKITDSAAGATAFSAGRKTYNGAIAVGPDSSDVATIIERVSPQGLRTGLVATSSITHATPAAFYAHVPSRNMHEAIAADLAASEVDFFAGGGLQFFARRSDGLDYLARLAEAGFAVDTTALPAGADALETGKKYGYLLSDDGLPRMLDGRGDFLPQATQLALDFLARDDAGFFLMVEGSQIDWGGHANEADYLISEQLDFDRTVGRALDFAEQQGNTLVVVTADHETGGFTLSSSLVELENGRTATSYNRLNGTFSTGGHSATLIPVFAYGPGAERFAGVYENTAIYDKILEATGW